MGRDLAVVRVGEDLHGPSKLIEKKRTRIREERRVRQGRRENEIKTLSFDTYFGDDGLVRETRHVGVSPLRR